MAIAVNLLNDRHALSEKDYQTERKLLQYAVIFFTLVVVVILAIGLLIMFYTTKLNVIEGDISRGTKELSALTDASAQQIYLKNRLQLITSFLDGRSVDREAMQRIFNINIPGVVVSSVSFESDKVLAVQLTAQDSTSLEESIKLLSAPTSFFTQVISRGISRNTEGKYQLMVSLSLPRSNK